MFHKVLDNFLYVSMESESTGRCTTWFILYTWCFSLHGMVSYGRAVTNHKLWDNTKLFSGTHGCCNVAPVRCACRWMTRAECAMPAALCITELWEELLSVEDVVQVAQVGQPVENPESSWLIR